MEKKLWNACDSNKSQLSKVKDILKNNPELNVNWSPTDGWTALHLGLFRGHLGIVRVLLAHPAIAVNPKDNLEDPLYHACINGSI